MSLFDISFKPKSVVRKICFHFAKGNTEHLQIVNSLVVFQISDEDFPNSLLLKIRNGQFRLKRKGNLIHLGKTLLFLSWCLLPQRNGFGINKSEIES